MLYGENEILNTGKGGFDAATRSKMAAKRADGEGPLVGDVRLKNGQVEELGDDGSADERAEWWEGGVLWGLGLGVVAEKRGLMKAFDETLFLVRREAKGSEADQELERGKRRIASRYLSGGAGLGAQAQEPGDGRDGFWGDHEVDGSGKDSDSNSDSGHPSSDSSEDLGVEEEAGEWMGGEEIKPLLSRRALAGRRRHGVMSFEGSTGMSVRQTNTAGRGAEGDGGGKAREVPAGTKLAGGNAGEWSAWGNGREGGEDGGLACVDVPPLFPHAVPKTILGWVQSRREWQEWEDASCCDDGGLGLMLDKAAMAAAEEKAGA